MIRCSEDAMLEAGFAVGMIMPPSLRATLAEIPAKKF